MYRLEFIHWQLWLVFSISCQFSSVIELLLNGSEADWLLAKVAGRVRTRQKSTCSRVVNFHTARVTDTLDDFTWWFAWLASRVAVQELLPEEAQMPFNLWTRGPKCQGPTDGNSDPKARTNTVLGWESAGLSTELSCVMISWDEILRALGLSLRC